MTGLWTSGKPAFGQSPLTLTLDEAITIGHENSRIVKIASAKADVALARAGEAATALLPSISLSAGYQRLSDVDPFQVFVPFAPQPITIAPVVLNTYSARVSLQQPLFTGFKLSSNAHSADLLARAAVLDSENEKADLTLNIAVAYWTLYQSGRMKEFVEANVARLEAIEVDTKNLMRVGLATRNDLLKVQLQISNARIMRIDAANDHRLAMMMLNNLIGLPLETELRVGSLPQMPERTPEEPAQNSRAFEAYAERAWANRPDVRAMHTRVDASLDMVRAAQGNWWPHLFLTAGYTYARPNLRYQPTRDEFKGTWDIGVQLQFNVWNWGATARQTEQAAAALRQSEVAFEHLKENVALDVQRHILALARSKEKVAIAQLSVEQAHEHQRMTRDKYQQGLATSSDMLEANVAMLQAETAFSAALVEFQIAQARRDKTLGITIQSRNE